MKRRELYKIYLFLLVAIIAATGCDKFGDMNEDPSQSTQMDPNMQLPTIQLQVSGNKWVQDRLFIYAGAFAYHVSGSWAIGEYGGKGKKENSYMSILWSSDYPVQIKNIVDLVERTKDKPELKNLNAVSRIMSVYLFSRLTDIYGDIPYFDAGKGYYTGTFLPKYDKQEDIYNNFFTELTEASATLSTDGDKITYDIYYNGDINKWKKFANSLHLRLAMRLTKVAPEKAKIEAEAAIAANVMESSNDICMTKHLNSAFDGNDWGTGGNGNSYIFMESGINANNIRVSSELVKLLEDSNDPRLPYLAGCYLDDQARTDITQVLLKELAVKWQDIAVPASTFTWELWRAPVTLTVNGNEFKDIEGRLQQLQPSKYICAYNAPYFHLNLAEVKFLMAEAAFRGWNTGGKTAAQLYTEGLEAALKQVTLYPDAPQMAQDKIAAFVSANTLNAGTELEQINTQLWANLFLNEIEAYTNLRRSGYPVFAWKDPVPAESQSNHLMPRRYEYPLNEQFKNLENYTEAIQRMGGTDSWTNRVWWDKQ